jgi:hypothetical protein
VYCCLFTPHHLFDFTFELGDSSQCRLRLGASPRPSQICIGERRNRNGREKIWGRARDDVVSLRALSPSQPHRRGLALNRIVAWVDSVNVGPDFHYRCVSHSNNCAGIARRALAAGGAGSFLRLASANRTGGILIRHTARRLYFTRRAPPGQRAPRGRSLTSEPSG